MVTSDEQRARELLAGLCYYCADGDYAECSYTKKRTTCLAGIATMIAAIRQEERAAVVKCIASMAKNYPQELSPEDFALDCANIIQSGEHAEAVE